jgi:hypothetical protein
MPIGRRLMCPPTHFGVVYEINPWMHVASPVDVPPDPLRAADQWVGGCAPGATRTSAVEVVVADPVPGLPDMVFTANAGVTTGRPGGAQPLPASLRGRGRRRAGGRSSSRRGTPVSTPQASPSREPATPSSSGTPWSAGTASAPTGRHPPGRPCPRRRRRWPWSWSTPATTTSTPASAPSTRHHPLCPVGLLVRVAERVRRLAGRVIEVPDDAAAGFACNAMASATWSSPPRPWRG